MERIQCRIPEVDLVRLQTLVTRRKTMSWHIRRAMREYLDRCWIELIQQSVTTQNASGQTESGER